MAKLINLKINGKPVSVPEGTMVVDAAKKAGIDIPVFCYHPKMEPVAMCRQCLVEIGRPVIDRATGQPVLEENGQPKLQFGPKLETSCSTPVSEGMVVITDSEKARAGQREILELLLTSHPLDCPVCDKGGECPLQNLTMKFGPKESRFLYDEKHHAEKHFPLGDLIFLDRERCIQCARCVRFQSDIAGEPVLGFSQRGRHTEIVTYSDPGFDSVFSGNTTDICPVGALTTADFRFGARPWELKSSASICSQCPVGCNVTFNVRREVKAGGGYVIKRAMPRQNEQVNEIWMCDKGRFAGYQYTEADSRLKLDSPELDQALSQAAVKLAESASQAVFLAGGRLSNEDFYTLKQFATRLGAKAYLYTRHGGGEYTTRYGLAPGSNLGNLGKGDTVLVVASDLYHEAPLWYLRLKAAAKRGATLIVANARATKLDEFATFVIRYSYGDEVETVKSLSSKEKVGEAIKNTHHLVIFYGADGLGLTGTTALAQACADLFTSLPVSQTAPKANNGLIGVWSTPNQQGALEMGFAPCADLAAELKDKTVYILAADPAGDDPTLAEALKGAKAVIAQDILETETTRLANIVLPAAAYTEREGTFTSGERRVQRFYPAVPARPGTKADFVLIAELAKRCGIDLEGRSALLVMNQIVANEPAFSGITYAKLAEVTEQWPIIGRSDLFYGGTGYENKQGLGVTLSLTPGVSPQGRDEQATLLSPSPAAKEMRGEGLRPKEDELLAVPITKLYDNGTTVAPAKLLAAHIARFDGVFVNPATAKKYGLENGSQARVSLNGVTYSASVLLDESISTGVVLIPRSFGIPLAEPAFVLLTALEPAQEA
ncbi:MAG: molybdopterin-dependent oxidoreductase [Anaerolineales bacterium]|nr:molybdopterin-dependent oxidoreductase [Anaerolineales bacterium]